MNLKNVILFNVPFVNKVCLVHSSTGNASQKYNRRKIVVFFSLSSVAFKESLNLKTGVDYGQVLLFRRRSNSSSPRYISLIPQFRTNKTLNIA
jgi:hypothetical protein